MATKRNLIELTDDVSHLYTLAREAYNGRRLEREVQALLLTLGRQSYTDGIAFEDDEEEENPRTKNVIRGVVRAATAVTLRQKPNFQVPASRSDYATRTKAKATEDLCQAFTRNGVFDMEVWYRAVWHSKVCGLSFVKTIWNRNGGTPYLPEITEDVGVDPFGAMVMGNEYPGEIEQHFVSSFDGLPDPAARNWKECRHFFHVRLLPKSVLEDMFETDVMGNKADFGGGSAESWTQRLHRTISVDDLSEPMGSEEMCELVDFWEMPSKKFPNGRYILTSGDIRLYAGPNPLWPRRLPFTPIYGDNIVAGSMYPAGVVEDLISPQGDINLSTTKIQEWVDKNVNEYLLAADDTVDESQFTNRSGGIINHKPGFMPQRLATNDIPGTVFNFVDMQVEALNLISGYGDVTRGNQPNSDLSGRAHYKIEENENAARAPMMMLYKNAVIDAAQQAIYLARQFYDEGRMLRMVGENSSWRLAEFSKDDYDWDNQLVPAVYSGRPESPAMRFAEVLELINAGILSDSPEGERGRSMLAQDNHDINLFDPNQVDREKAERLIMEIKNNPYAEAHAAEFDNHVVHIKILNDFRKTLEYENLPEQQQQAFDLLVDEHEQWDEMQMQQQAMDEAMMQGAPQGGMNPMGSQPVEPGMASPPDGGHSMIPSPMESIEEELQADAANFSTNLNPASF